jgi:prenyltransferase beta subunit
MSVKDLTLMVMPDRKVWIDSESLISYMRMIQRQAGAQAAEAHGVGDFHGYAAAVAVDSMMQQMADSLQVTALSAIDRMERPRVS